MAQNPENQGFGFSESIYIKKPAMENEDIAGDCLENTGPNHACV